MQTIHYLRYGVVPVGVTEGMAPAEKLDKLVERSRLLYGHERSSNLQTAAPFGHASQLARQLLEAMVSESSCSDVGTTRTRPTIV